MKYINGTITNKFLTITGNKLEGTSNELITINKEQLKRILDKYMKKTISEEMQPKSNNISIVNIQNKSNEGYLQIGLEKDIKLKGLLNSIPSRKQRE